MKYIKDINKVNSKVDRIIGLQKLQKAGLDTPKPVKIILPQAFKEYQENKQFFSQFTQEVFDAFSSIRNTNPDRGVYAGRAFYVPGIKQPPGPRSSSVKDKKIILKEVKKLFDFAIKNKFDKKSSEIGCILYPFINPIFPYAGGCVTPSQTQKNFVVIEAIYGNDEGIQSLPHDTYQVNLINHQIIDKNIPKKTDYLQATSSLNYTQKKVPKKFQLSQVISDDWLFAITKYFTKFILEFGSHRLEFALQPEGIFFRECVPFTIPKIKPKNIKAAGTVIKVTKVSDLKLIENGNKIIFIDPKIIRSRNFDLITSLAFNFSEPKIILYPGSITTAHASTILRETGHTLVFVENQVFKTKDKVEIKLVGSSLKATKIK